MAVRLPNSETRKISREDLPEAEVIGYWGELKRGMGYRPIYQTYVSLVSNVLHYGKG